MANSMITEHHYSALEERVHSLSNDVAEVKQDIHGLRSSMASGADMRDLSQKIDAITTTLSERSRPQWQVIFTASGVALSILVVIGGMAYWPISQQLSDLKITVKGDVDTQNMRFIPRAEILQRWVAADARDDRQDAAVSEIESRLRTDYVPKDVIDELRGRLDRLQAIVLRPWTQSQRGSRDELQQLSPPLPE